jgi:uncharacterized membrane protein
MTHEIHEHIERRKRQGVHTIDREHIGFNGWLASIITRGFGSMWAFYALVIWMFAWMFLASIGFWLFKYDQYPFTFLLFLSNLVQLWALPVLAVGQQVLSRASDKQAAQTYKDAEMILQITYDVHKLIKITNDDTTKILDAIKESRVAT